MYALKGELSGELISYYGAVLVHDNRTELAFLFPRAQIVSIPVDSTGETGGRPTMPLKDHPDMHNVQWPLENNQWIMPSNVPRRS